MRNEWICAYCGKEAEYSNSGKRYCRKHWETYYLENKIELSVNILTWNTYKTVHDTLHVLANDLKDVNNEIIIVDNGSKDGCQDLATIKNPVNLGISKGKNQGVDASRGEFILLLDGDIVPVPNSVLLLLQYMRQHPEVKALGFRPNKFAIQQNRKEHEHFHEDFCHTLFDVREHKNHCIYFGMYQRSVFDKCRFDEEYGIGYGFEDLDFYKQMEAQRITQYFCDVNHAGGKYYHNINSSIKQLGEETYRETSKKRGAYFDKKWGTALCSQS